MPDGELLELAIAMRRAQLDAKLNGETPRRVRVATDLEHRFDWEVATRRYAARAVSADQETATAGDR